MMRRLLSIAAYGILMPGDPVRADEKKDEETLSCFTILVMEAGHL